MSRLNIEISPEQHQQIKAMAALQGISIKELVLRRLFDNSGSEEEEWSEFVSFLKARIHKARSEEPSGKTLDDIASEVVQRNSTN